MSPFTRLSKRELIIPALFALGHILAVALHTHMAALTGLAGAATDTLAYL